VNQSINRDKFLDSAPCRRWTDALSK